MPLTDTTRNIRIDGTTLLADCKGADGKYKPASVDLDNHLGIVDGRLRWGYKGFAQTARNIRLEGTQITAEIKGADGKWSVQKVDINTHLVNNKGVLEHHSRSVTPKPGRTSSPVDLKLTETPSKLKTELKAGGNGVYGASAIASAASASSLATSASASSMFSSSSMSSSTSYESHTTSKQTFSASTFRSQSMQMSIRETCFNLVLEGSLLWADCLLIDGVTRQRSSIDLDQYIGLVNGQLVFGATGFTKHKHLRHIRLEGFIIYAEVFTEGLGERWVEISIDISEKFKNKNGVLIAVTMNADLSVMLSEIPWMKFKVIAEPDMSVFARHPVMQQTMTSIAESTVEHVTVQMSTMIQTAIRQAVEVVTKSAMVHIQQSMEAMVQDVVGYGRAHGAATASGELRLMAGLSAGLSAGMSAEGGMSAGGYAYGMGSGVSGGYAYGSGSAVGGGVAYGASGGAFSTSSSEILTGGAMLTSSSGSLSSASETHEEFFTNTVKAGGKIVTPGRNNNIVEMGA